MERNPIVESKLTIVGLVLTLVFSPIGYKLTIVDLALTLVFSFIDCYNARRRKTESFTSSPSSLASSVSTEPIEKTPKQST